MVVNTHSKEEFKKVLKSLFAEKQRVKALQKQLDEIGFQKKFQVKLSDIHKLSITEEYAKLKTAYLEKEKQLEKVKPALKKLVNDLKQTQEEIKQLETERGRLVQRLAESLCQLQKQTDIIKDLRNESFHETYEAKLVEAQTQRDQATEKLNTIQEQTLEKTYSKMRELSKRHASLIEEKEYLEKELVDREKKIRKAQHHLAKKVKETAILRDFVEKQKEEIFKLEPTQELQVMMNEWQEKYLALQQKLLDISEPSKPKCDF